MTMRYGAICCVGALVSSCFVLPSVGWAAPSRPSAVMEVYWGNRDINRSYWSRAISHFRQAIGKDSRRADAFVGLGRAYRGLGDTSRARESFAAALRIKPHIDQAETGLHDVMSPEEHDRMLVDIETRAKNAPRDADLQTTYAEELLERNRYEEAEQAAKSALQIDKTESHAQGVLGLIALHRNQKEEAVRLLGLAIRADDSDDDSWAGLGDIAMSDKDFTHAATYYRGAVKAAPDHADWHEKLAAALTASGDTAAAALESANAAKLKTDPLGKKTVEPTK